ncbi:hypothetical protein RJ639_034635 [Escallonia herrerae]|uniref:Uncharacterized protein n=1 Tax=Escallonia herrerae TaxID=1293975 RepID=A0AA89BA68_9ASTE|nr:hypothetical protein RJ639_034635 [Escallonia herrerae]
MDEFGVVLGIDFMEKSSTTLNPYCESDFVTVCVENLHELLKSIQKHQSGGINLGTVFTRLGQLTLRYSAEFCSHVMFLARVFGRPLLAAAKTETSGATAAAASAARAG